MRRALHSSCAKRWLSGKWGLSKGGGGGGELITMRKVVLYDVK